MNALASPLKLLGALSLDGGKVEAFRPEPIGFVTGQAEIADDAWWRIEQLAGVLAASPALRVELTGETSADDVRALQEAAVLADLQQEQGFLKGLRNLPSRGTRNAVRAVLEARAKGEPSPEALDEDDAAQLEAWLAAKPVGEEQQRALASARERAIAKKGLPRLADVRVQTFSEGPSVQVLHTGPYADEPADVERLYAFAADRGLRITGAHHEIYLNDPARTAPDKLKTIIRFGVSAV